ncbi:MAG: DUF1192 domain-containing protein [Roseibium sp.]
MNLFDEDVPKKPKLADITVGQDLSRLSEEELTKRIEALTDEINRTQRTLEQRGNIRDEADAFFRK